MAFTTIPRPSTPYTPINELGVAILMEDSNELLAEDGARLIMEEAHPTIYATIPKPA